MKDEEGVRIRICLFRTCTT